ncbi:MAG: hypothetical protein WCV70_00325 [Patescibacteria group bacterium]
MSPSKGLSRGQIGKIQEMIGHGILKSTVFQDTPTAEVDRFIKKVGPGLRDAWVELLEKRFQDFIGAELLEKRFQDFISTFLIPVDYDEPEAIAKAIEMNKFDWKYVGLSPAEIPLVGTGRAIWDVHEVPFGRMMYNSDLPNALKQRGEELGYKGGFKFVDPLTALRFAWTKPDRQKKHQLAISFIDKGGRSWSLCLSENNGERHLYVYQFNPGDSWDEHVRFLAVCELPSVA